MRIVILTRFLTVALTALLAFNANCYAFSLAELAQGDYSDSGATPTPFGPLSLGVNTVVGTMGGTPLDRDIFTFSVASGSTLTAIDLVSYNSPGNVGGGSFFSFGTGTTISDPNFGSAGSFGHAITSTTGSLAAQFNTPIPLPLGAGDYTMWIQETAGDPVDYQVDFTTVPEPAGLLMIGMLGCFLVFRRKRK